MKPEWENIGLAMVWIVVAGFALEHLRVFRTLRILIRELRRPPHGAGKKTMTSLEYADRILQEFRPGKRAASVVRGDRAIECLIVCTDGTTERTHKYWAVEILRRLDAEKAHTGA